MWFKQFQIFKLGDTFKYATDHLIKSLEQSLFRPCLPSMAYAMGWATLLDEDEAPLIRTIDGCSIFCLQIEEKILPATVVSQAVDEKIKQIELSENRKLRQKEKLSLKDETIMTLLPRAFSKLTKIYAYIDSKNNWLVLGTKNKGKTEQFLSMFKKTVSEDIHLFSLKKMPPIMTHWLKEKSYSNSFSIEKACVFQDPDQQIRMIRCQQQDLFAGCIQQLIKEGYHVKQLAISWHDQLSFVLADDFSFSGLKYQDEIREQINEVAPETALQRLDADFLIMATTLSSLLKELLELFIETEEPAKVKKKDEELIMA